MMHFAPMAQSVGLLLLALTCMQQTWLATSQVAPLPADTPPPVAIVAETRVHVPATCTPEEQYGCHIQSKDLCAKPFGRICSIKDAPDGTKQCIADRCIRLPPPELPPSVTCDGECQVTCSCGYGGGAGKKMR